jgi:hypothetical protein
MFTQVTFTFDEDITGPVYMFYELSGFYQNHLRYISSISADQMLGEVIAFEYMSVQCLDFCVL